AQLAGDPGLDQDALRALAKRHEVGFHTLAHDRLVSLADDQLSAALAVGRDELEAAVGRSVTTIAYPHGAADERVAAAARSAGYAIGFAGGNRAASAEDGRLLVPRLDPWHRSLGTFAITLATAVIEAAGPPR
ncbi:MAG: polysaccharide deacetylase family protein, partial [Actinobacteria bacterium]|nr:polysaccharide deacetylase family protein [Actinomycetota bacterium]